MLGNKAYFQYLRFEVINIFQMFFKNRVDGFAKVPQIPYNGQQFRNFRNSPKPEISEIRPDFWYDIGILITRFSQNN